MNVEDESSINTIEWKCVLFADLNTDQFFDLTKLRIDIFVVEQSCPYPELDEKDRHAKTLHLMGFVDDNVICCARLLAPGISYAEASIGRFAVASTHRRLGIGTQLMHQCLQHIESSWPQHNIRMSAQKYLKPFYTQFGFEQTSEMYLEDNIPHIEMFKDTSLYNNVDNI